MTAQELRVGNLIIANGLYEGKIVTVDYIGSAGTLKDDKRVILFKGEDIGEFVCDCIGIPLTEDWLMKANGNFSYEPSTKVITFRVIDKDAITGKRITKWMSFHLSFFKSISHFQNVTFDLTGEELKLKEE